MSDLLSVRQVYVPRLAVAQAHTFLQQTGRTGNEALAFWVGELDGRAFHVRETLIPKQTAIRTRSGVGVRVEAPELHRINVWLYERGYRIMAQLHSHPGEAYHSETDDDFSVSTTAGSVSLVVPNFARFPFSLIQCAVFRLSANNVWLELLRQDVRDLIIIE